MSIWDKVTGDSNTHDILLLGWADKHPILYTLIEVSPPYVYVVATVIAVNIAIRIMSRKRR